MPWQIKHYCATPIRSNVHVQLNPYDLTATQILRVTNQEPHAPTNTLCINKIYHSIADIACISGNRLRILYTNEDSIVRGSDTAKRSLSNAHEELLKYETQQWTLSTLFYFSNNNSYDDLFSDEESNDVCILRNEPSDQLTKLRGSTVLADLETKTRCVLAMFGTT